MGCSWTPSRWQGEAEHGSVAAWRRSCGVMRVGDERFVECIVMQQGPPLPLRYLAIQVLARRAHGPAAALRVRSNL
jgi:hypothetical protein